MLQYEPLGVAEQESLRNDCTSGERGDQGTEPGLVKVAAEENHRGLQKKDSRHRKTKAATATVPLWISVRNAG